VKKTVETQSSPVKKPRAKKTIAAAVVEAKPVVVKKPAKPRKKTVKQEQIPMEHEGRYLGAYLTIDFPIENEVVSGLDYAIRIGASKDGFVELALNDGEWRPCRFSSGYWWFDWGYFTPGEYKISARLVAAGSNDIILTKERNCKVC
jgi:hypothetical protein